MVKKRGIFFAGLIFSLILLVLLFFSSSQNNSFFTGKYVNEDIQEINNKNEIVENVFLDEYIPKSQGQEEVFLDRKFKDDGRYIISSLNSYSAEWYPTNSPKSNFKKLVIELQITDKTTWKNFSIKGTADIPKYYSGHFDFNTSSDNLVVFEDLNPDFFWEYSEDYEFVSVEKKEEAKFEEDRIKSKTFVKEKKFNNYKKLDSNIKDKIPKELFLDPDVSACGSLTTAGATYSLTTNVSSSTTCFTVTAANITLNCSNYWITYGSSAGEYYGVFTDQFNSTIKNCNIYNSNRTTGYWGSNGIYLAGSTNSTVFKNYVNNSNSPGIYLANADYNNLTSNFGWTAGSSQGIRLASSDRNILVNNTGISNSNEAMALTGNSSYNLLINNTGKANSGRGLFIWQGSYNNTIIGMNASGGEGIRFNNATKNIIRDCIYVYGTNYDVYYDTTLGSTGNVFLNCSYNTEYITTSNSLIRQWYYQAYVNESGGSAVSSANITGKNSAGVIQFTEDTNSSGWIQRQNATEYINSGGTRSYYNNYMIHANKSGYINDTNSINFTLTQNKINDFFTLTSTGGDTTSPTITFESPTPNNASTTSSPVTIVANISDASNTSSWIDLDRSLVGYWAMDYYNSTGVYDNSTYNHLATFYAGTTSSDLVDGSRGNAFDFDGGASNEGLIAYGLGAKTNDIFNSSGQLTFSFWVYPDVLANGTMGTNTVRVHLTSGGQIHITMVNRTTNYNQFDSSGVVSLGQWSHITLTYNRSNGNASTYHNGVLVGSKIILNANLTTTSDYFTIGTNWGDPFNGAMDEVMAFNRTLSQAEIKALYSSQINKFNTSVISLADGQHNYIIYAIDEAGNTANSGLRNFIVGAGDSTPPTISFESPTPSNSSTTSNPVTIVANISDASNTSSWIDLDRSLLGYWSMDYYNSTGVYDNSSWNNFGVFTGGLDPSDSSTGVRGDSFVFDGASTSLTVPTSNFDYVGNLTISVWVYPKSIATDYTRLIHKADTTGATKGFGIVQGIDSRLVGFYQNSYYPTGEYMAGTGILSDNQWYHVVMTYSTLDNGVNMYVDGINASASYVEDWAAGTGNYFSIGKRAGQDNAYFNGSLDEIFIVNRTLSQAEIKALYSSQINKFNTSTMSLADGQHNYTVYAIDESGNINNSGLRNFIVGAEDSTAPIISLESPTPGNGSTTSNPITIVANISDASNTSSWIDLDRSLVGYWAMDYANSTHVFDNSSYRNNGSFNGGLGTSDLISGKRGDALDFDGNDYIKIENSASLNVPGNLTISLWVYPVNLGVDRQGLVYKHYNNDFEIIMEASGQIEFYHGDGTWEELNEPGSMVVSEDTWNFISITRDALNKKMFFYLNGNYLGYDDYTDTPVSSSDPVYLGVRYGSGYYFNGSMDEVMIFNRNLSLTEIKALYSSQINKFNSSSLILADGQHNYTVYAIDESGNINNSGLRNFIVGSDSTPPTIIFESPTPDNASSTTSPVIIVANISDISNTSSFIDFDRNLLGYWAMDYYNSTVIFDNSTYKNNATFQQGVNYSNLTLGKRGDALRFDGSNDYLKIKDSASLDLGTSDFSISFWANFGVQDGGYSAVIGKKSGAWADTGSGYEVIAPNDGSIFFHFGDGSTYVSTSGTTTNFSNAGWKLFTITLDRDGNALTYVDGVLERTNSISGAQGTLTNSLDLGIMTRSDGNYAVNGSIDELLFFNKILSPTEIKALYSSQINKFNSSSLILTDGQHNYTVYAIDEYGNIANSGERNFIVGSDSTPPTITFESPTPDNTSSTTSPVMIVANISDASNTSSWIDLDRSLRAYLSMDYANSTHVFDNSSYRNNGSFNGGLGTSDLISGKRGDALDFDGADDRLISSNLSLNNTDKISVSFWIKFSSTRPEIVVEHSSDYNANNAFLLNVNEAIVGGAGHITLADHTSSGYNLVYTTNHYNDGNWHHVAGIIDRSLGPSEITLYVDGVNDTTYHVSYVTDQAGNFSHYPLYIGGRSTNSINFTGVLDEFMLFGRALSLAEVKSLYSSQINKFNSSSLILTDGQHNYTVYAIDESGNINNSGLRNFIVGSDSTPPTITFESPTPDNASSTDKYVTIIANISDASNTSSWIDLDKTLVGYWSMDYYNSTGIFDNSSYNHFGTFMNNVCVSNISTGIRGDSLDFSGGNDYTLMSSLASRTNQTFNSSGQLTFSAWINPDDLIDYQGIMGTDTVRFHVISPNNLLVTIVNRTTNYNQISIDSIITTGNWHHVALTYNRSNGNTSVYHNGAIVGSKIILNANLTTASDYFTVGLNWGDYFNGRIDEAMVFNRTLSQSEVKALYNSKSNKFNTSNLSFTDGQHNYTVYAIDESGNINNSGLRNFVVSSGVTCGTISSPGTYVLTSNLTSTGTCFTVTAADVTIDCNNFWINFSTGGGAATSGVQSTQLNTTIKNCNIVDGNWSSFAGGSRMGIRYGGSRGLIHNNFINISNGYAIYLEWAQNNTVTFNRIMSNSSSAFGIDGGNFTDIINNTIKSITSTGAYFSSAHNNNFMNNSIIAGNTGLMLITTSNNTIFNNTLNSDAFGSSEIYSQRNNYINNTIIAEGIYGQGFFSQHSNNTLFRGNTISAGYYGFDSTTNSYNYTLIGNKITAKGGYYAVYIEGDVGSGNHTLINNTLASNTNHAIYLLSSLNNNLINNTATSNTSSGIYLYNSSNNNLTNNNATTTDGYGIYIYSSLNNILISNNATSISQAGMFLSYSNNTSLNFNNASSRYGIGFRIEHSSFNNIINNFGLGGGSMAFYLIFSNNNLLKNNTGLSTSFYGYDIENCLNITLLNNNGTSNGNGNGIYLYNTNNSNLTSNRGTSIGLNGIYMIDVFNNNLINNLGVSNANNGIVLMRGFNNLLINNTAIATGAESALNLQNSFNNSIINQIAIANGTSGLERYAVYIESSNNTIFRDCITISGTAYDIYYTTPSPSINNTFVNCSYAITKEQVQTGSQLIRKWYYQAYVNYSNGTAAAGANISAYNVFSSTQFTENTNGSGWIQRKEVIEYINTAGTRGYYNNYTINASKSGYTTDNNILNFTIQQNKIDDWFTLYNNTCQYDLGNWFINCADNCSIPANYNLEGNNISIIGVGTVTLSGNISNFNKLLVAGQDSSNICTVRCVNGGCFKF